LLAVTACVAVLLAWQSRAFAQINCGPPVFQGYDLPWDPSFSTDDAKSINPLADCYMTRPPARFGTAIFDVLLLNRSGPDFANLARVPGGAILTDTNDVDLPTAAGFRFQWTFESACGNDLQFAYMGSHGFHASQAVTGPSVTGIFFNSIMVPPSTSVTTSYDSHLDSGELNLRSRKWRHVSPVVGLRVLQVHDEIRNAVPGAENQAWTDNELFGVQFGFEAAGLRYGPWTLEATLKAGVFYNDVDVVYHSSNINFTHRAPQTSFVGDLNLMLRYQFTPRFSMRVGYQALWLDRVALIPDQYDEFDVFASPVQGNVDLKTVQYHGGLIGFEATW
jgi:hypothetical protein